MKQNYRRRQLTIRTGLEHINELESFLDKICDDFHIYDDYYGNVVTTLTSAYELITEISRQPKDLNIRFQSRPSGVMFSVHLDEDFLHIAAKHQKVKSLGENKKEERELLQELDETDNKLMIMSLLSDNMLFDSETETVDIYFYITGINDMLAMQRTQLLHNYYERLLRKTKTHQQQ